MSWSSAGLLCKLAPGGNLEATARLGRDALQAAVPPVETAGNQPVGSWVPATHTYWLCLT